MAKKKANISGVSLNLSQSISKDIADEIKEIKLPLGNRRIGISVSDSEEYGELGYSKIHQKDITVETTRYLLVNGAHLVYGGDLRQDGYTYAFSELAFQYRKKELDSKMHYTNYFGWPIHLKLENSDDATFKRNRVRIIKVEPPTEVPIELRSTPLPPSSPENKYYWAKSMTKMRKEMVENCDARILIGGKLSDYKGFFPGIIEEASFALEQKQPIYLIGAFGGATSILIRAIKGEKVSKLENELLEWYPSLRELYDTCAKRKDSVPTISSNIQKFQQLGLKGLSKINRLTSEQNEILFETKHFSEIIFYTLAGLKKSFKK